MNTGQPMGCPVFRNRGSTMKLSDIAEIRTGLVLARRAAASAEEAAFTYQQLNLKCIMENGTIDKNGLDVFYSTEKLGYNYLTYPGDIIIRLTVPNTSVLINEETQDIVVSSHFCIIRTQMDKAIPEYIQWYLNSDIVKGRIAKSITGGTFAAIKPSFLSELEIKPLSLAQQQKIADIYITGQQELSLLEQLKQSKELLYKTALENVYQRKSQMK